jgi:hypothetical protein
MAESALRVRASPAASLNLHSKAAAPHASLPVLSTFLRIGVPFFEQGNFGWGEKQVKKTLALAAIFFVTMTAVVPAIEASQNAPQQETAPSTAGSSTARSHHSKHRKRSKSGHHKTQKHHTSKQHTQPQ